MIGGRSYRERGREREEAVVEKGLLQGDIRKREGENQKPRNGLDLDNDLLFLISRYLMFDSPR